VYDNTSAEAHSVVPTLPDRCWLSVIAVAQTIDRAGEARHDDVCAALGITDGGGLGSTQLANLRRAAVGADGGGLSCPHTCSVVGHQCPKTGADTGDTTAPGGRRRGRGLACCLMSRCARR
jgi:hypothetical protein